MSGQIHQMQVTFLPAEDRLLFRFNTTERNEYNFWLTRRYVRMIWPILKNTLAGFEGNIPPSPAAREALVSFQHQKVMSQADFSTTYQKPPEMQHPLGETPILLSRLRLRHAANGLPILCLHPEQGQGVDIPMSQSLLHSFCGLLAEGLKKAEWNLALDLATSPVPKAGEKVALN
jgi:hypothetical protein